MDNDHKRPAITSLRESSRKIKRKENTRMKTDSSRSLRLLSRPAAVFLCLAAAMPIVAINSTAQAAFLEYSASAYGTRAFVGSTIIVGQTAPVSVGSGCGTAAVGITHTGTVATVSILPTIHTGAINTSASSASNAATGTSDIHDVFLLGATKLTSLIAADEVKAVS